MTDTNDDLDALREQTETGSRLETSSDDDEDAGVLKDAIGRELEAIASDEEDAHPNVTMRDANLAALVRGLEATDRLDEVAGALDEALGNDSGEDYKKADVARKAARVALWEVSPDVMDELEDAVSSQLQV